MIGLRRNSVLLETARALKSNQQIANKSIGLHEPVDCVKKSAVFGARKTQQKNATSARCN